MYAKSMLEFTRARAIERGWSKYLYGAPVLLALAVATLPFALKRDWSGSFSTPPRATAQPVSDSAQPQASPHAVALVTPPKLAALPLDQRQRAIAAFITRKYGVSGEVVQEFVRTAFAAGKQYGIDPLLVVAMMAVESSFNPIAESVAGAKGLMQIIPKYHLEKLTEFGGEHAVFDPRVNIVVGARIVREYLMMASGDLFTALQTYAGALADKQAVYTHRVLNEKDQLDDLAGLPKTDRSARLVEMGPLQPGGLPRIVVPLPVPLTASATDSAQAVPPPFGVLAPFTPPAVTGLSLALPKYGDEATHTPAVPFSAPAALPAPPAYPPAQLHQPQHQLSPLNTI